MKDLQRLGLRALTKVGGMPALADPTVRGRAGRLLTRTSSRGFAAAEVVARQTFARRSPVRAATAPPSRCFDLTPTEDQEMLRSAARAMAAQVIRPAAARADTERTVPAVVHAAATDLGLNLVGVPTELDGIAESRSAVTGVLVMEALAHGDLGIATALMSPSAVAGALAAYGSAAQQASYLPAFTGASPVTYAALALAEPQPLFDPLRPHTRGSTRGAVIVLDGEKALVPGAAEAELLVISARVDGVPRLVLLEPGTRGVSVVDEPAMGLRAAHTGRVRLDGVAVPRSNLLGSAADHLDVVRRGRLAWAAATCGTAQAVLDQVSGYVLQRRAFGEPIAHRQAVAFMVADIAIELDALRLVVWRAAALLDHGKDAAQIIAHARSLAARHGSAIGSHGVQLLGGHGFVKEFDNERWFRDLRGAGLMEGTLLV